MNLLSLYIFIIYVCKYNIYLGWNDPVMYNNKDYAIFQEPLEDTQNDKSIKRKFTRANKP